MKSAAQLIRDTIVTANSKSASLSASSTSTTTNIYSFLAPIAEAAAMVGADAERVLFARSFLASQGKNLDNVVREISVKRLLFEGRKESDNSLRINGPKIFTPEIAPTTVIDDDATQEVNQQLFDIEAKSTDQIFTLMKSRFFRLQGATDLPMMMPRYWMAVSFLLREMYDHIVNIVRDNITEDSEDIADTDWIYRFDALRVFGVRDAKVQMSDYNELTIHIYIDERLMTNSRGQETVADESAIISDVISLASKHLPKPDHRTLRAPRLIVRMAQEKSVYVQGILNGIASITSVKTAIENYFYNNKLIGGFLDAPAIADVVRAIPGVIGFSMPNPTSNFLIPAEYEILNVGYMDITKTT